MYKSIMVFVFILTGLAATFYYKVFGFDHFFEPDTVQIFLEAGKEIDFNLEVTKSCTHEIGIGFISEQDDPGHIRMLFGEKISKLNLPARIDISIVNDKSETIFENKSFGGDNLGFRYGSTHIKFIAGKARLLPGTYRVKINVYELLKNLEGVNTYFFAAYNPKTRCGELKENQFIKLNDNSGEYKMSKVCNLQENVSEFQKYIFSEYGKSISSDTLDELSLDFEKIKDKVTKDPFYSRTDEVRFLGFSKKCTAADDVTYEWQIAATINLKGEPIIQQLYLVYEYKDIFDGKRDFSFKHIHGSNKDYSKLLSKSTVGIFDADQFSDYMKQLGGIPQAHKSNDGHADKYLFEIDPKEDMASRLAAWNFSKEVIVKYDTENIVQEVIVRGRF